MTSRPPIEAIRPIHQRGTFNPDDRRVRDELELYHTSTHQYLKDAMCAKRCKYGDKCVPLCPAHELLRYARRDEERIGELMNMLHGKDSTIEFLRCRVRELEQMAEGYRVKVDQLQRLLLL